MLRSAVLCVCVRVFVCLCMEECFHGRVVEQPIQAVSTCIRPVHACMYAYKHAHAHRCLNKNSRTGRRG